VAANHASATLTRTQRRQAGRRAKPRSATAQQISAAVSKPRIHHGQGIADKATNTTPITQVKGANRRNRGLRSAAASSRAASTNATPKKKARPLPKT
jgi:hypothetical protein